MDTDQVGNTHKVADSQGVAGIGHSRRSKDDVKQVMNEKNPRQDLHGVSDDPIGCRSALSVPVHVEIRARSLAMGCWIAVKSIFFCQILGQEAVIYIGPEGCVQSFGPGMFSYHTLLEKGPSFDYGRVA